MNVYDELKARGFVKQSSQEEDIRKMLAKPGITYYVGFDPTAESLHVGNTIPLMAMAHLQRAGHFPIVILGEGTAMIGDPSGKTEARRLMTHDEITLNSKGLCAQFERFLTLNGKKGLILNNAQWLSNLSCIDFLRNVGRYFRVNEMMRVEGYKQRFERQEGLSFTEFGYQLLQAYDFLILYDRYNCTLQMGGDDQWGNITAGIDIIRRVRGKREAPKGARQKSLVYGLTFPLLETASGHKMGKTEKGTVWLDSERTSPYEFYQYWINMDDADIPQFLRMFTFLSIEAINTLLPPHGVDIRRAKAVLAYEATKIVHGEQAAQVAQTASRAAFYGEAKQADLPTVTVPSSHFKDGVQVLDIFVLSRLVSSKSEARRLIHQGGLYLNEEPVADAELVVGKDTFQNGVVVLRRGKKQYCRLTTVQ